MQYPDDALIKAWQDAARDLGLRITAPFTLEMSDRRSYRMAVHLPDFGHPEEAPAGLLVYDHRWYGDMIADHQVVMDSAVALGYEPSGVNPAAYVPYSRAKYVKFLCQNDWLGEPGSEPSWYRAPSELPF
jgi:hypothetical protein